MSEDLRLPWEPIPTFPGENGAAMVREAEREIGSNHLLAGKRLETVARRCDQDDVLFLVEGGPLLAVVHLTWSGRKEPSEYPRTDLYPTMEDFLRTQMAEDAIEYGEE